MCVSDPLWCCLLVNTCPLSLTPRPLSMLICQWRGEGEGEGEGDESRKRNDLGEQQLRLPYIVTKLTVHNYMCILCLPRSCTD